MRIVADGSLLKAKGALLGDEKHSLMEGLDVAGNLFGLKPAEYDDHVAPVAVVNLVAMLGLFDGSSVSLP